jgi:hypothetical protein
LVFSWRMWLKATVLLFDFDGRPVAEL